MRSADIWVCGRCGGSAHEHSLETSTCIWEPVAAQALDVQGNPLATNDDERCTVCLGPAGDDSRRCERLAHPVHNTHLIDGVYHLPSNNVEVLIDGHRSCCGWKSTEPTNDEREALAINYCPEHGDLLNRPDGTDARSHRCRNAHEIDELHARFRRSEVPEPSAEECQNNFCTRGATMCGTCSWRKEPESQCEPSDALREAIDHIQGAVEFQDVINPEAVRVVIDAALRPAGGAR